MEIGRYNPSVETLKAIASVLDIPVSFLLEETKLTGLTASIYIDDENKTDERSSVPQGETSLQMTRYQELNEENRRIIDQMIEKLVKSQFDD